MKRHPSHRANPVGRGLLCLLFRSNRKTYRHRRNLIGPFFRWLFRIPERRTNYAQNRYYDKPQKKVDDKSQKKVEAQHVRAKPPAPRASATQAAPTQHTTIAERHKSEYFQSHPQDYKARATPSAPPEDRPARFGAKRPTANGAIQANVHQESHGTQRFQPLPHPTGPLPYHLSLDKVIEKKDADAIQKAGRILFHMAGDTGGVKSPESQQIVAMAMEAQFNVADDSAKAAFYYNLGDVVYYFGEGKEYFSQFYEPYEHYPAPIFAIPGNHDGDLTDGSPPSLTAFVNNFCQPYAHSSKDAGESSRDAMIQPHVYWTLLAPFVTIVGLWTNVPEGGKLDDDQINWFINELKTAPKDKALLVAGHHPVYSADSHHSGSKYMQTLYENAFKESGRTPDAIFAGHVHNYQRFTRNIGGQQIPYIVAGAGGYWHLHYMAKGADGKDVKLPYKMPDHPDVTLESSCDDHHGFLRMMVTPRLLTVEYLIAPHPQDSWRAPAQRVDAFVLDLQTHKITKNGVGKTG